MKRSTLTLSILTALLVSACGGSSSNDEQTKDPTPPKVTPTKPTPPSSGQTPTTGNTGNAGTSGSSAGSSASSSSSSDPTPPISSGSAPSGGKPIVITSETGKTKEKDKDKDKEPQDDPIKTLEAQLAKAKDDLIKSGVAVGDAKADLEGFKPHKTDPTKTVASRAWQKQDNLRKGFFSSHEKLGLPENVDKNKATIKKIGLKSIEAALKNNKSKFSAEEFLKLETNFQAYKEAREAWINADQEVYTKIETLYNAEKQASEDQKKFDSLAAELRKKTADPIKAEADFYDKQMKLIEQQYEQSQKAAELKKIEEELAQKKTDADSSLKNIRDDLIYARDILKSKDPSIATELAEIEKKIAQNTAEQATLTSKQKRLTNEKTPLDNRIDELKKDVEKAKEIAGNRGVSAIGAAGLSKDNFLQIQSAELVKDASSNTNPQTWKLTFSDGSSQDIDLRDSSNSGNLTKNIQRTVSNGGGGGSTTVSYGKFGTSGATKIAFQDSSTAKKSIYGYIDDRFYSVGKVADPKVVDGLKNSYLTYSGKALLQAGQQGLIADVRGHVRRGEFGGEFYNFATYDRASTGDTVTATAVSSSPDEKLKALKEVPFSASVQGNKFMTKSPNDGEASVYGYFYGSETEVKEAGGLVQLKDVFHGSFGGEVKEK